MRARYLARHSTPGDDAVLGFGGAEFISTGAGDERLDGGANSGWRRDGGWDAFAFNGADTLAGGAGIDTASYATAAAGVAVSLAVATAQNTAGAGTDTLAAIEALVGSAFADGLTGSANADTLNGAAGDDSLTGGAGADSLDGGAGVDWADYGASAAAVSVSLAAGVAGIGGDAAGDRLACVEALRGSAFNDTLAGADSLDGGAGLDWADYGASTAAVSVSLVAGAAATGGDAAGDRLMGIKALRGGAFNDTLAGGTGNDTLEGGAGNDALNGGAGLDTASYASATAGVTVSLATTAAQATGGAGTDTLTAMEALVGSGFNDGLAGSAGADTLDGGAGNDTLQGGAGADALTGGVGADAFRFAALSDSAASAMDVLLDFSRQQGDRIDLAAIDPNASLAGDQAFAFVGAAAFSGGGAAQVRYRQNGAGTFVEADTGDGVANIVVQVKGLVAFVAADFVL